MKNKLYLIISIFILWHQVNAEVPIKSAKEYLYILLHGEDGKNSDASYKIFSEGPGGGLKSVLENTYNLSGYVFAYQMSKPSGSLATWTREFGDLSDSNSMLNRARREHKEYLKKVMNISNEDSLEIHTPKTFIVIAHSYGGLAVREFICSQYYNGNIKTLITVNTPHSGSEYPYILEVLETRTAVGRLEKIGTNALKSVDAKNALTKAIQTAYNLKKTYDSIAELLDELKRFKTTINNIEYKINTAEKRIRIYYPAISMSDLTKTLSSSINQIKDISNTRPNFETPKISIQTNAVIQIKDACRLYKTLCDSTAATYRDNRLGQLYSTFYDFERSGNGRLEDLLNNSENDNSISSTLFIPEEFSRAFDPAKFVSYQIAISTITAFDYPTIYSNTYSVLTRPTIFLSGNSGAINAYEEIKTVLAYADSFSEDAEAISDFNIPKIQKAPFDILLQNPLVKSLNSIQNARNSIAKLGDIPIKFENAVSICSELFSTITNIKAVLDNTNEAEFYESLESLKSAQDAIRYCFEDPQLKILFNRIALLKKYQRALTSLQGLKTQNKIALKIDKGSVSCDLEAVKQFPKIITRLNISGKIEADVPNTQTPIVTVDYPDINLKRAKAFLSLLEGPEIPLMPPVTGEIPSITIPSINLKIFDSPAGIDIDLYEKTYALVQSVSDCIDAFKDAVDIYYDIKDMASNIKSYVNKLNPNNKTGTGDSNDKGQAIVDGGADLLSSLLIGMCVAKFIKPAENAAASSASFSAIGKNLGKALVDGLWKEIESGGILEVGFAEATVRSTSAKASDPSMAAISSDGMTIRSMRSEMPIHYQDTAINKTKYRIVYTSGVLTPTKSGTKTIDMVSGSGGTEALIRGQIEAELDKALNDIKSQLSKKIKEAVKNSFNDVKIPQAAENVLINGTKPGGDFKAAVDMAKRYGVMEAYRNIIEKESGALIDASMDKLTEILSDLGNEALDQVFDKLKDLEVVKKGMDFLDKLNPGMIISLYNTISTSDKDLSIGQKIFALYYSPLLKLGLYNNGDFISTAKSQQGNDVLLFNQAADIKRYQYKVSDPLGPFAGIAALGLALDVAYYTTLATFPASAEPIRLTKIVSINLLSVITALSKKEELKTYFIDGHKEAVLALCNQRKLDDMLFEKPYVSIRLPKGNK